MIVLVVDAVPVDVDDVVVPVAVAAVVVQVLCVVIDVVVGCSLLFGFDERCSYWFLRRVVVAAM